MVPHCCTPHQQPQTVESQSMSPPPTVWIEQKLITGDGDSSQIPAPVNDLREIVPSAPWVPPDVLSSSATRGQRQQDSMDSITAAQEKPSLSEVENAKKQVVTQVSHYAPMSDEEKALDRRVNLKMDFTLLVILAIGFIVRLTWLFLRTTLMFESFLVSTRRMSDSSPRVPLSRMRTSIQMTYRIRFPW
jgi:hypothetical protein